GAAGALAREAANGVGRAHRAVGAGGPELARRLHGRVERARDRAVADDALLEVGARAARELGRGVEVGRDPPAVGVDVVDGAERDVAARRPEARRLDIAEAPLRAEVAGARERRRVEAALQTDAVDGRNRDVDEEVLDEVTLAGDVDGVADVEQPRGL